MHGSCSFSSPIVLGFLSFGLFMSRMFVGGERNMFLVNVFVLGLFMALIISLFEVWFEHVRVG